MEYKVSLENFEGPLFVLISLIEKNKLEITEINLAKITGDFLEYIKSHQIPEEFLFDFLIVLSRLLVLKSKALLPKQQEEEEENDFKKDLKQYKIFYDLSKKLKEKFLEKSILFSRDPYFGKEKIGFFPGNITINHLHKAIKEFFLVQEESHYLFEKKLKLKKINLKTSIEKIFSILKKLKSITFSQMIEKKSLPEIVSYFLALLHLLELNQIEISQENLFGEIRVILKE
ncbi:segregation/condensation protein A [bacterium]|nr:segregation/condensation protein A [bacterium]